MLTDYSLNNEGNSKLIIVSLSSLINHVGRAANSAFDFLYLKFKLVLYVIPNIRHKQTVSKRPLFIQLFVHEKLLEFNRRPTARATNNFPRVPVTELISALCPLGLALRPPNPICILSYPCSAHTL